MNHRLKYFYCAAQHRSNFENEMIIDLQDFQSAFYIKQIRTP
jgi:hypothetical protein